MHVNSRDEALALPSEESVQLSLRTQQILAHESGIADVVDPLGGSYFVEDLTHRLEKGALDYIKRIDDMGGAVAALESGYQVGKSTRPRTGIRLTLKRVDGLLLA